MSIPRPSGPPGTWFQQFGVTPEVHRRVLDAALSRGGDDADLFFEHTGSTSVRLSDSRVNRFDTRVDLGMGVRVTSGDQYGYAFSESDSMACVLGAAAECVVHHSLV